MKKLLMLLVAVLLTACCTSCYRVKPDGGEEAVLIKKPYLFGSGGVVETPVKTGATWCVYTTDYKIFQITPLAYAESFADMMTDDNTPVSFTGYLRLKIKDGQTPILYEKYREDWYKNNIQPTFRTMVRDAAASRKMFELTSNRDILSSIERSLFTKIKEYIDKLQMPIEVQEVTIGRVIPPSEVLDETRKTASQNQQIKTQEARVNAEKARGMAEKQKAIADNAYRKEMNMTIPEYLQLRNIEVELEKLEVVRNKTNVSVIMASGTNVQPMYNVK